MARTTSTLQRLRLTAVAAILLLSVAAAPAFAQHHARLSADLADHVAAGSQRIDVIVHGDKATIDAIARRHNLVVKRYLTRAGAVLQMNAGQLSVLSEDADVDHLSSDIRIHPSDVTMESIGADQAWAGLGDLPRLTGEGVTIAVIDTGVDVTHNALKGHVRATVDFTGGDGADRYGHGTHVAATIAGAPGQTSDTRDYRGVAYRASIINLRALGDDGSGTASNVIEAIDWAVDHRREYKIRIINLSLGAPALQAYRDDPLCEAVERAYRAGILVVASAGNFGTTVDGKRIIGGVVSPGISPYAITVGAVDTHYTAKRSDDTVAAYSSRGPTQHDLIMKPDLVAPGSHIPSAEAAGSYLATTFSQRHVTGAGPNAYMQLSGTSMAAAVVSGAAALLLEERPELKPAGVKAVLQATSTFMPAAGLIGCGAGDVNVIAAAEFLESAQTAGISATTISGERVLSTMIVFAGTPTGQQILWTDNLEGQQILWTDTIRGQQILWTDAITRQQILWTDFLKGQQILWTDAITGQQILWTDLLIGQQILWTDTNDQILWTDAMWPDQIL